MQTEEQFMREFLSLLQEPETTTPTSTKQKQIEYYEDLEAEKHKTLRQVDGKFRRGNNKQNHKKKGRK